MMAGNVIDHKVVCREHDFNGMNLYMDYLIENCVGYTNQENNYV